MAHTFINLVSVALLTLVQRYDRDFLCTKNKKIELRQCNKNQHRKFMLKKSLEMKSWNHSVTPTKFYVKNYVYETKTISKIRDKVSGE